MYNYRFGGRNDSAERERGREGEFTLQKTKLQNKVYVRSRSGKRV